MTWQKLPTKTEIVAIHAALLTTSPDGDIVYFGDWAGITPTAAPPTLCRLYHMAPESVESFQAADRPTTSAFCGGQAFLARGELLAVGGTVRRPPQIAGDPHGGHWDGERACWVYLPRKKMWIRVKDLNFQPGSTTKGGGRWYPTVVTLANGDAFAVGGHPSDTDDYVPLAGGPGQRHNNNTPERYSPAANTWTLITTDITAPNGVVADGFPRFRLLPNGLLFTHTEGIGTKRIFDPVLGQWTGPDVDVSALPAVYNRDSYTTSVLLPLLPPNYSARVLACNSPDPTSFLIDIDDAPKWQAAPSRQGSAAGKRRNHACAVLLPTGQVPLTGGGSGGMVSQIGGPFVPVMEPELYTPDIDWSTRTFTGPGSWATINESANVARGYHSVALLLPDGRVWTAGSSEAGVGGQYLPEYDVEVFSPWYVGTARPRILPSAARKRPPGRARTRKEGVDYGETFNIAVEGSISHVALMRCGSITHAYDTDQRYVALDFIQRGNQLAVTAPPNGSIAPPGYYMLWVIDANGNPCERARFIHVPKYAYAYKAPAYHTKRPRPRTNPRVRPGHRPRTGPRPR